MSIIDVYTDGSSRKNGKGEGSYSSLILLDNKILSIKSVAEGCLGVGINHLELMAIRISFKYIIKKLIHRIDDITEVNIYTDSQNCIKCVKGINNCHIDSMRIIRDDIRDMMDTLKHIEDPKIKIDFYHVKGHSGHMFNEMVDKIGQEISLYNEKKRLSIDK